MYPDEDMLDLIEDAFLSWQIDALQYALADIWLRQFGTGS